MQIIIKRKSFINRTDNDKNEVESQVTVTGDQVVVNTESSVTVTFTESETIVDLA